MATYDSLTTEQKQIVQNFTGMLRSWAGELARANNHAAAIQTDYNAQASAVIALLDANEVIPNNTGYGDAVGITASEVGTVMTALAGLLTTYNTETVRERLSRLAGPRNLIG